VQLDKRRVEKELTTDNRVALLKVLKVQRRWCW